MDLTPKQQASELLRQAQNILIVTGREPSNDQLASAVGLHGILTKLGKTANVVISDKLPKIASALDTSMVARDLNGTRDFVVHLDTAFAAVDKLRYDQVDGGIDITITPFGGNFEPKDASFKYGAYQFDLVVVLGVPSLPRLDRLHEANPTIFDGLHLINIDYHRINENYGSVNLVDSYATCVAEILISIVESLGQGMIDAPIATAFLGSFMSTTANFTAPSTTAKALTIAAQMMSAGAKQQEIVRALSAPTPSPVSRPENRGVAAPSNQAKIYSTPKPAAEPKPTPEPNQSAQPETSTAPEQVQTDGSKKNSKITLASLQNQINQAKALDHSRVELTQNQANPTTPSAIQSPLQTSNNPV